MKFICILLAIALVFGVDAIGIFPDILENISYAVKVTADFLLPTHLRQDPVTFDDSYVARILNDTGLDALQREGAVWAFEPNLYRHTHTFYHGENVVHNDHIVIAYRTTTDGNTDKFIAHVDDITDTPPYEMFGMFAVTTNAFNTAPLIIIPILRETKTTLEDIIRV